MHSHVSCSVQPVVGRETPMDMESKQVTSSSNALQKIYDGLSALPRMTTSDVIMPSNRRVNTWDEKIYIPEGVEQYVLNDVKFAGVSTSTIKCGDDALIIDGGAISTLTKSFENCTLIRPKVVAIQTAGGATSIYTTHICLKTYFFRDRTGTIRPIVVKAYIVPALLHDLLSVKGLNKSGYRVIHDEDDMESGVYAVINRKINTAKSFAFMSEHSNLF